MTDLVRSRLRWRRACLGFAGLWLVTAATGAYLLLDQSVTLSYHEDSWQHLVRDFKVLTAAGPVLGGTVTKPALLETLRRQHPDALISATDSTVAIGQLTFRFSGDGRLRAIDHPDIGGSRD